MKYFPAYGLALMLAYFPAAIIWATEPCVSKSNWFMPAVAVDGAVYAPPTIAAVAHEAGQPPRWLPGTGELLIRRARFQITVRGDFDPLGLYDVAGYFNGEEIGRSSSRVAPGTNTITFDTHTGFPPGGYALTVTVRRRDLELDDGIWLRLPVKYQPTYVREMNVWRRDVTDEQRLLPAIGSPSKVLPMRSSEDR